MKRILTAFVTVAVSYCALCAQAPRPTSHVVGKPGDLTMNVNGDAAGPVAITGGKLLTVTHGVIENGVIVLSGGKIAAVGGPGTAIPKGAQIVDAKGMTVYPGLVDAETNLGLIEIEADLSSNDLVETSDEIMPQMQVAEAFHAETVRIPVARLNGVTNAIVAPASEDSVAGQDAFIQLYGHDRDQMILGRDVALAMNFSGEQRRQARRGNPPKYPSTRMGLATQLRQAFLDAQNYEQTMAHDTEKQNADKKAPPKRDLKLEALLPYLKGEKPVVLGAHEGYEVEVAMELAQEFHLKVILSHVEHSQDVLDKIASYHVPVIVGPIYTAPAPNERYDAVYSLPAQLQKRGVKIAIASYDTQNVRNLPYAAGYAVAYGLPYDEALKAITLNPAEMFGWGDKLGSLDVGKMANVVIANGDPLDVKTDVKQVYIQGIAVSMESRQTKLRDAYMKK
ncbi:MAG TPA: amidohydrolase family protein [Acidobacteriaceae bacterium]|nr:amidohydrolase family protein [Acidobacteriaceae bacterium]